MDAKKILAMLEDGDKLDSMAKFEDRKLAVVNGYAIAASIHQGKGTAEELIRDAKTIGEAIFKDLIASYDMIPKDK